MFWRKEMCLVQAEGHKTSTLTTDPLAMHHPHTHACTQYIYTQPHHFRQYLELELQMGPAEFQQEKTNPQRLAENIMLLMSQELHHKSSKNRRSHIVFSASSKCKKFLFCQYLYHVLTHANLAWPKLKDFVPLNLAHKTTPFILQHTTGLSFS